MVLCRPSAELDRVRVQSVLLPIGTIRSGVSFCGYFWAEDVLPEGVMSDARQLKV